MTYYLPDTKVAERYDIGRSTVWYWLSINKIPDPKKINGRTRWKLSDLEKWEAGKS